MTYKQLLIRTIILVIFTMLAGCGGGSSDGLSVSNQELTVQYVERELQLEGYTTAETSVIYESPQSATYEFKRIIISKVNNTDGDTLAYAYSLIHPPVVENSRFVAFYIDIDNDPATGESIEGIGADRLLLDTTIFESSPIDGEYFVWSDVQSQWINQAVNGTSLSISSEERGGTLSINVPYYENINDLFGLSNVKGVFTVRTFVNGSPSDINAVTLAATTVFSFNTPM